MENALLWCSVLTSTLAICLSVASAVACWRRVSAYTSPMKRVREMEVRLADLESLSDSMGQTLRRISAREGMRAHRERASADAPPVGKEAARARYLHGRSHADIALMALNGAPKQ